MIPLAFSNPGKFFRGNLHTHSTLSDGVLEPKDVCEKYKNNGYDFICLTDHFVGLYDYPIVDTKNFWDENFKTILGAEVHSGAMENGQIWHLLAVGLDVNFEPSNSPDFTPSKNQETGPALAKRCRDSGAFVAIAHPQWSGMTLSDAESIAAAHCVEVYNHGCAVDSDRPDGFHTLDLLLSKGKKLNLIATDDAHFKSNDFFGGWVQVKAKKNDPTLLLRALKNGEYFSSQGPNFLNIEIEKTGVLIESSPIETAIVVGFGSSSISVHGHEMKKTEIKFPKHATSPWVRIIIIDKDGKRAWSNPIYDEF